MKTALKIGPADHGRELTDDEFESAEYDEGYRYELIDGRLFVSPAPEYPHEAIVDWLDDVLRTYSRACPQVIDRVSTRPRVFVPGRARTTCPEPDFAAYQDFPRDVSWRQRRWRDVSPILVVEVISDETAEKDL